MKTDMVKRTERGWGGHFICAERCLFRRNTLLEYENIKIVVSTVGLMADFHDKGNFLPIGYNRYYETMAFHAKEDDVRYHDADVSREISFNSNWAINELDADDMANLMHEAAVNEITNGLLTGEIYEIAKVEEE